jgi:hypothetical protein
MDYAVCKICTCKKRKDIAVGSSLSFMVWLRLSIKSDCSKPIYGMERRY